MTLGKTLKDTTGHERTLHDTWSLVFDPWSLVLGPWSLVLGAWSSVLGPWSSVFGPLVLGLRSLVLDPRIKDLVQARVSILEELWT